MAVRIRFDNQTVIVTGAGNGLGKAYALEFARRGANVVVNDVAVSRDEAGASRRAADMVVAEVEGLGARAVASYESVATADGAAAIVASAIDHFGSVEVVVNNAGTRDPAPFEDMTASQFDGVVASHLYGSFFVSQAAYRVMKENRYGRFVFVGSTAGMFGSECLANYAAAKSGITGLSAVISLEGECFDIKANTILPVSSTPRAVAAHGRFTGASHDAATENGGRSRLPNLTPAELAPLTVLLASRECPTTHGMYAIGWGRIAEVFTAVVRGWTPDDFMKVSAEAVLDAFNEIEDKTEYAAPRSLAGVQDFVRALL